MKINEIMTKKVITVMPETAVKDVAQILYANALTGVPVIDSENHVVGIINESDIISQERHIHMPTYLSLLDSMLFLVNPDKKIESEIHKILGTKALDIMTKEVITIGPEDDVSELATLIVDKKINPVPVVGNGVLVGIVSRSDLVRLLAR